MRKLQICTIFCRLDEMMLPSFSILHQCLIMLEGTYFWRTSSVYEMSLKSSQRNRHLYSSRNTRINSTRSLRVDRSSPAETSVLVVYIGSTCCPYILLTHLNVAFYAVGGNLNCFSQVSFWSTCIKISDSNHYPYGSKHDRINGKLETCDLDSGTRQYRSYNMLTVAPLTLY